MGEYVPQAPINDEAKKHNKNLPGMGGKVQVEYRYGADNCVSQVKKA